MQFLVLTLAAWLNRHQEDLIDYLREENRILSEQLVGQPLRLTDAQRGRLAVRGRRLGRRALTDEILKSSGVQPIRLPLRNPNLNAYAGRFVRSIREDCLNRVVMLGEGHLRLVNHE